MADTFRYAIGVLTQKKFLVDERQAFFSFSVGQQTFGILPPSNEFFGQLGSLLIIAKIYAASAAFINYKFIIPHRGSSSAYLAGFGVVLPIFYFFYPIWIIQYLDVHNFMFRFFLCAIHPTIVLFRTSEAMFGFSRPDVEDSLRNYIISYSGIFEFEFDENRREYVRPKWYDYTNALVNLVFKLIVSSTFLSLLLMYRFQPFRCSMSFINNFMGNDRLSNVESDNTEFNVFQGLVDPIFFLDNVAVLSGFAAFFDFITYMVLVLCMVLYQAKAIPAQNSPLLESKSPSDFWGRRWNRTVHGLLKRGVFKPVYKYWNRQVALVATFVASGLFHEFILYCTFFGKEEVPIPRFMHISFFLWFAIVLMVEYAVGGTPLFQWMSRNMPKFVRSFLVLCTGLPVAHWFFHVWVHSGFFEHGSFLIFVLTPMPQA